MVVLITATCLGSCIPARAGVRCRTAELGEDATHVLRCTRGRWRRIATKADVARALAAIAASRTTVPLPPVSACDAGLLASLFVDGGTIGGLPVEGTTNGSWCSGGWGLVNWVSGGRPHVALVRTADGAILDDWTSEICAPAAIAAEMLQARGVDGQSATALVQARNFAVSASPSPC